MLIKRLFGVMPLIIGVILAFAGCGSLDTDDPDDNNPGGNDGSNTVTFSLDKVNSTSFTLTVNGARWEPLGSSHISTWLWPIFDYYCQVTDVDGNSQWWTASSRWGYGNEPFDTVITSPTVRTFTLRSNYTSITGTISLDDYGMGTFGGWVINGRADSFKANPAKSSITF